jgi:hypothetical protein
MRLHPKLNIPDEVTRDTHIKKSNALLCIHVCLPHPASVSIFSLIRTQYASTNIPRFC